MKAPKVAIAFVLLATLAIAPFTSALQADLNKDGLVNEKDKDVLIQNWGTDSVKADLNGDLTVDGADLGLLLSEWSDPSQPIAKLAVGKSADLNGDGFVNDIDKTMLLGVWGKSSLRADLNSDGTVDGTDLGLLLGAWNDNSAKKQLSAEERRRLYLSSVGKASVSSTASESGFDDSNVREDLDKVTTKNTDDSYAFPSRTITFKAESRDGTYDSLRGYLVEKSTARVENSRIAEIYKGFRGRLALEGQDGTKRYYVVVGYDNTETLGLIPIDSEGKVADESNVVGRMNVNFASNLVTITMDNEVRTFTIEQSDEERVQTTPTRDRSTSTSTSTSARTETRNEVSTTTASSNTDSALEARARFSLWQRMKAWFSR